MTDTIVALCESEFGLAPTATLENKRTIDDIESVTESEREKLSYGDIKKVHIIGTADGEFLVEFSNNLERYIVDNRISFEEAIENLAEEYDMTEDQFTIVVDESCINKLDLKTLAENYSVKRV